MSAPVLGSFVAGVTLFWWKEIQSADEHSIQKYGMTRVLL